MTFRERVPNAWWSHASNFTTALISWGTPVIVALVAMFVVANVVFLTAADRLVRDIEIASLTPAAPQDPDVVIVSIDEDTLRQFTYREPVDRQFLSALLRKIAANDPRAVGLDFLFDQPTEPSKDAALAQALRDMRVPTFAMFTTMPELVDDNQRAFLASFVPPRMRSLPNFATDQTDTVRWIFPGQNLGQFGYVPGFVPALATALGADTSALKDPRCAPRCLEIVWRGSPGRSQNPFAIFPAQAILNPNLAMLGRLLKDKIVLVGNMVTLDDRHRTPFAALLSRNGLMPGVLVHAHALSQLVHRVDPHLAGWRGNFLVALVFSFFGAGLGVWNRALLLRSLLGAAVLVSLWLGAFVLFYYSLLTIGLMAPTIAGISSFSIMDSIAGGEARRQRAFIHDAFSRYVSPTVVEQLERNPSNLSLEGERRVMTYLFSDIENFTTLSEKLESRELARLLNRYLDGVTNCVLRYDGLVDKFVGDAVFAIFNAPIDLSNHAVCAVRCAMEMDRFAMAFSQAEKARGLPFGVTRIGIHTGSAVVGNFGSSTRFNYTATGDAVNLASRLEGLNKHFHTRLMVSDSTVALCPSLDFRPIADVVVKGKTEAIGVWEPIEPDVARSDFNLQYKTAYASFKKGDVRAAKTLFAELAKERPEDTLVRFHYKRLLADESGTLIAMDEK
jgi:adenylate cyclase